MKKFLAGLDVVLTLFSTNTAKLTWTPAPEPPNVLIAYQVWTTQNAGAKFTYGNNTNVTDTNQVWELFTNVDNQLSITFPRPASAQQYYIVTWFPYGKSIR